MALPLIPIILAVTALGSGIVQGVSQAKNAKAEAEAVQHQAQESIKERIRQAKKLQSQQKTSFLKSGIYFDSGSPIEILTETMDTMNKDINAMANDANKNMKNLMRQGKTAFFSSLLGGVADGAMSFLTGKQAMNETGATSKTDSSKFKNTIQNAKLKTENWYNQKRGWFTGGFGNPDGSNDIRTV